MLILKRPPGDAFTFKLFFKLVNNFKADCNAIYVWSVALEPTYFNPAKRHFNGGFLEHETEVHLRHFIQDNISTDTIIIGVKDHLSARDFNPWTDKMPSTVEYLNQFVEFYSDKNIILLTSVENLEHYIFKPNVTIIPWGGDITNHAAEYKNLQPITSKNFDSNYAFVSLNRNVRNHRKILLSMLCGLNIQDTGLISCMFKDVLDSTTDIVQETGWSFREDQEYIKHTVENGLEVFKNFQLPLNDNHEIYVDGNNDNVSNFKNKLADYYTNTFVEIITETSYTERCYLLTEKTLNSIYGMNFPIFIAGQGAVKLLRSIGMDMFDDIIDHSYDNYENPIDRMYYALERNRKLLTDIEFIKEQWKVYKPRFEKNIAWAKTTLYDYYETRTEDLFSKCCKKATLSHSS